MCPNVFQETECPFHMTCRPGEVNKKDCKGPPWNSCRGVVGSEFGAGTMYRSHSVTRRCTLFCHCMSHSVAFCVLACFVIVFSKTICRFSCTSNLPLAVVVQSAYNPLWGKVQRQNVRVLQLLQHASKPPPTGPKRQRYASTFNACLQCGSPCYLSSRCCCTAHTATLFNRLVHDLPGTGFRGFITLGFSDTSLGDISVGPLD